MKILALAISMACILTAMAQDEEPKELTLARTAYQSQLKFAAQSYLQKLEILRKTPARPKNQVDAIQDEISRFKRLVADGESADVPDATD